MNYRSISGLEHLSRGESRLAASAYLTDRRKPERKAYWAGFRRNGNSALRRWWKQFGKYLVLASTVIALGIPALLWFRGPALSSQEKTTRKPPLFFTPATSTPVATITPALPVGATPTGETLAVTSTTTASPSPAESLNPAASAPAPASSVAPVFEDPKAVISPAVEPVMSSPMRQKRSGNLLHSPSVITFHELKSDYPNSNFVYEQQAKPIPQSGRID